MLPFIDQLGVFTSFIGFFLAIYFLLMRKKQRFLGFFTLGLAFEMVIHLLQHKFPGTYFFSISSPLFYIPMLLLYINTLDKKDFNLIISKRIWLLVPWLIESIYKLHWLLSMYEDRMNYLSSSFHEEYVQVSHIISYFIAIIYLNGGTKKIKILQQNVIETYQSLIVYGNVWLVICVIQLMLSCIKWINPNLLPTIFICSFYTFITLFMICWLGFISLNTAFAVKKKNYTKATRSENL